MTPGDGDDGDDGDGLPDVGEGEVKSLILTNGAGRGSS